MPVEHLYICPTHQFIYGQAEKLAVQLIFYQLRDKIWNSLQRDRQTAGRTGQSHRTSLVQAKKRDLQRGKKKKEKSWFLFFSERDIFLYHR